MILLAVGTGASYWFYKRYQRISVEKTPEVELDENTPVSTGHYLPEVRQPKGHTIIGGRYALINSPTREEAEALLQQTGIEISYKSGEKKNKFVLGQGQFGKLRLARDTKTGQFVGVKKIKEEKAIMSSKREAAIQIELNGQPNILPLLHTVETIGSHDEKVLYEFLLLAGFGNGEELQKRLSQLTDPLIKEQLMMHTARGLLTGMASMHELGIYHLDMKPSNFVIDHQGEVYIIDLGCARKTSHPEMDSKQNELTGDGRYFSPERWANCRLYSNYNEGDETAAQFDAAKADAWALGITLLEIALNRYPFDKVKGGERLARWDTRYFNERLQKIPELQNISENDYWLIVKGLLEPDPKKRLSPKEALEELALRNNEGLKFKTVDLQKEAFASLKHSSTGSTLEENLAKQETALEEAEKNYMTTLSAPSQNYEDPPVMSPSDQAKQYSSASSLSSSTSSDKPKINDLKENQFRFVYQNDNENQKEGKRIEKENERQDSHTLSSDPQIYSQGMGKLTFLGRSASQSEVIPKNDKKEQASNDEEPNDEGPLHTSSENSSEFANK